MYVGLIVRDECERSAKNQASKHDQEDFVTGSWVSCEKLLVKKPHVDHMTRRQVFFFLEQYLCISIIK